MWSRARVPPRVAMRALVRRYAEMHDSLEHATGPEKKELLYALAGNCDPWHILAIKRGPGTKDRPTLIPSCQNKRLLGCICGPHSYSVSYMWLHDREPKRCACGYWFELCPVAPF